MAKKIRTEVREQVIEILDEIQCDVCKKWFKVDGFEDEEFLEISKTYGFPSTRFGDMVTMEIEICEECTYEMLGPFCRLTDQLWPNESVVFKPMEDPEDLDIYQR